MLLDYRSLGYSLISIMILFSPRDILNLITVKILSCPQSLIYQILIYENFSIRIVQGPIYEPIPNDSYATRLLFLKVSANTRLPS